MYVCACVGSRQTPLDAQASLYGKHQFCAAVPGGTFPAECLTCERRRDLAHWFPGREVALPRQVMAVAQGLFRLLFSNHESAPMHDAADASSELLCVA